MNLQTLISVAETLTAEQSPFKVGDVVVWKKDLAIKGLPTVGQPGVVTRVLEKPLINVCDEVNGTPYFGEPLDIAVSLPLKDTTGKVDVVEFMHDSRRFRLATAEELAAWGVTQH